MNTRLRLYELETGGSEVFIPASKRQNWVGMLDFSGGCAKTGNTEVLMSRLAMCLNQRRKL